MTNQQGAPEALRLADAIDPFERKSAPDHLTSKVAADELRRLHAENERLAALVEAQQPAPSAAAATAEVENLRKALQFYADKDHFNIADEGAWDTVSGEPQNYWCDEEGTATVEDGTIARLALAGHQIKFDADAAPQPTTTPQADSQPAPVLGTIAHVGTGKTTLARAIASALRAAPVEQPNTAYAALPAECDSPELCAVSRSCAGQFGTKRICASRGQAPAQAAPAAVASPGWKLVPVEPTPEMWKAARAVPDPNPPYPLHYTLVWDAMLAAAPAPPTQAADSVLEDAARLDWLEADESKCVFHLGKSWYTRSSYGMPYRKRASLRAAIDAAMGAARKQGANHD